MKKLITAKGEFVNYSSITKESDHWLCDGIIIPFTIAGDEGTIEEYVHIPEPMPIEVPQTLTPRQIRMVLTANNLRQAVEDAVAASTDYNLKDWWEYSLEYLRDNPLLNAMTTSLGLTSEQVDQMFIEGAEL